MESKNQKDKKVTKTKAEKVYTPFVELPSGVLAEQAFDGKDVFYIVYDPRKTKDPLYISKIGLTNDGEIYYPINNDEAKKKIVFLPSNINSDPCNIKDLFKEAKDLLNSVHEAPNEMERNIDVAYILLTYFADLLPIVPYRRIMGKYGSGKSRWIKAVGQICYRGLKVSGCSTDKALVRLIDKWKHPTAIIDEADFSKSDLYSFMTKILNVGHDRSMGFYQRCEEDSSTETKSYDVFGPKLLATRKSYWDTALESRCITFYGRENAIELPLYLPPEFEERAEELRNKLTCFRLKNYEKFKEKMNELYNPGRVREAFGELKISQRIKQVLFPLWLIGGEEIQEIINTVARQMHDRILVQDEDAELETLVKETLRDLYENEMKRGTKEQEELTTGCPLIELKIGDISMLILTRQGLSEIKPREQQGMSRKVIQICRTRLGIEPKIGKKKARIIRLNGSENFLKSEPPLGSSDSSLVPSNNEKTNRISTYF